MTIRLLSATPLAAALLAVLICPQAAAAQGDKGMSEKDCRNANFPASEERLIRACDANYSLCANPPPVWQEIRQVMQVCEQIKRESQLQAAKPGLHGALLARPMPQAMPAPVAPAAPAPAPAAPVAPATVAPGLAVPMLRTAPKQVAPAAMPAQPAAVFNPSSPDEAVLAPYPRGFDIAPNGRRYDGFAVGQPGPVRVMVRSAQPVLVTLRRPDGRLVERAGSGDITIDDAANDADLRAGLLWGVSIRPQQPGAAAQGQILVSAPPADPQAVRAALERDRQAAAQRAQATLAQAPAVAVDPNAVIAARQRELDQQTLARHSAALQKLRAQLPVDTVAVMSQAQQARAQGQPLAQTQQAMVNDQRIARLTAGGGRAVGSSEGSTMVARDSGRLLAPTAGGATATPQGGGGTAQASGTPVSPAVAGAIDRMFKKDGSAPAPTGGAPQQVAARPVITSTSEAGGDPGTPVMIQGSNFGNTRGEVRFIVANGRDLPAPITFWSPTQIMAEVPDVSGVREFAGQMYVKRPDGAQTDLRPFAFRPAMERRQVFPPGRVVSWSNGTETGQFEDARIHPYAVSWAGPSRYPNIHNPFVQRWTALFGGSGRDEYFLNGRLSNGWRVESCTIGGLIKGSTTPVVTGSATVTVAQCPVGSDVMRTSVDWWFDFRSDLIYSLTVNIVGPKGIPHE